MALFLFSCVFLCWALQTKQREHSCGDVQEGCGEVLSLARGWGGGGAASGQLRPEAERSQRERVRLMQGENVSKLKLQGPDLSHSQEHQLLPGGLNSPRASKAGA